MILFIFRHWTWVSQSSLQRSWSSSSSLSSSLHTHTYCKNEHYALRHTYIHTYIFSIFIIQCWGRGGIKARSLQNILNYDIQSVREVQNHVQFLLRCSDTLILEELTSKEGREMMVPCSRADQVCIIMEDWEYRLTVASGGWIEQWWPSNLTSDVYSLEGVKYTMIEFRRAMSNVIAIQERVWCNFAVKREREVVVNQ